MLISHLEERLHPSNRSAELGNAWANENLFTAAEATVWLRYHNYVASRLQQERPAWSDEELFQKARKTVVATFQVGGIPSPPGGVN